jgi:hypothetical protein
MNCTLTSVARGVLLAVLLCALLCLSTGAVKSPDSGVPPAWHRISEAPTLGEKSTIMRNLGVHFDMADISLEVREQVDFLLTPALLVQEAISDGVILTYPEE